MTAPASLHIRAPARARRRGPATAIPATAMSDKYGRAAPNCLRQETDPVGGTAGPPPRRCAALNLPRDPLRLPQVLAPPGLGRLDATVRAPVSRSWSPRRVRWRARTPASAAPATAAEAVRDNP